MLTPLTICHKSTALENAENDSSKNSCGSICQRARVYINLLEVTLLQLWFHDLEVLQTSLTQSKRYRPLVYPQTKLHLSVMNCCGAL